MSSWLVIHFHLLPNSHNRYPAYQSACFVLFSWEKSFLNFAHLVLTNPCRVSLFVSLLVLWKSLKSWNIHLQILQNLVIFLFPFFEPFPPLPFLVILLISNIWVLHKMIDIGEKKKEREEGKEGGRERGRREGMREVRKGLKEDSYTLLCFPM